MSSRSAPNCSDSDVRFSGQVSRSTSTATCASCTRTLDGRTVPYESLSGGAKEQLGILARLAGAALVAKEDAVPILIDDALGFTDPERLVKMAAVFDTVGRARTGHRVDLHAARYDGVKDAQRIELCA